MALTAYRAGLCGCGNPVSVAHHHDNDGWYRKRVSKCHACAAVEKDAKDEAPAPGEKVYSEYTRPDDLRIGERATRATERAAAPE